MATLAQRFRELVQDEKNENVRKEKIADVGYATKYPNLDYLLGSIVDGRDEKGNKKRYVKIGLTDGSLVMVIGRSGSGKSTLVQSIAANIVKQFPTSSIFADLIESGMEDSRNAMIMRMNSEEIKDRCIIRNEGITTEVVLKTLKLISDEKLSHRKDYEYDTGLIDDQGNHIYKLEPTVYIIDSLIHLFGEEVEFETESKAQAMGNAKALTSLIRKSIQLIKAANIIMICINHILDKPQMGMFPTSQDPLSGLKSGETVPGGRTQLYDSTTLLRLDNLSSDASSKIKPETLGFDKSEISFVRCTLVKSRATGDGISTILFLNKTIGFDPEWSMYIFLKTKGFLIQQGVRVHLKDSDISFYQKEFKELLHGTDEKSKKFQADYQRTAIEALQADLLAKDVASLTYKEQNTEMDSMINAIESGASNL